MGEQWKDQDEITAKAVEYIKECFRETWEDFGALEWSALLPAAKRIVQEGQNKRLRGFAET